jgi:hypothetical protein
MLFQGTTVLREGKRVNKKEFIGHSGIATKQAQDGTYELDTTVPME